MLNLLRECRQAFFSNLDSANAKDFWKAVKMLGTKSTTFPSISNGTAQADTGQGKAHLLNTFFYFCFNRSCSVLSRVFRGGNFPPPQTFYIPPPKICCNIILYII